MSWLKRLLYAPITPPRRRAQGSFQSVERRLALIVPSPGRADRELVEWARELVGTGEVVWDVGCGRGAFALASAVLAGPTAAVLAVDRDDSRVQKLRHRAEALGVPDARLDVLEAEVVRDAEEAEAAISDRRRRSASQHVTLDALLARFRAPTLVRLAFRESEEHLFAAGRLLRDVRPVLLLRTTPRLGQTLLIRLHSHRYELFNAEVNPNDRVRLQVPAPWTLAVPR